MDVAEEDLVERGEQGMDRPGTVVVDAHRRRHRSNATSLFTKHRMIVLSLLLLFGATRDDRCMLDDRFQQLGRSAEFIIISFSFHLIIPDRLEQPPQLNRYDRPTTRTVNERYRPITIGMDIPIDDIRLVMSDNRFQSIV